MPSQYPVTRSSTDYQLGKFLTLLPLTVLYQRSVTKTPATVMQLPKKEKTPQLLPRLACPQGSPPSIHLPSRSIPNSAKVGTTYWALPALTQHFLRWREHVLRCVCDGAGPMQIACVGPGCCWDCTFTDHPKYCPWRPGGGEVPCPNLRN